VTLEENLVVLGFVDGEGRLAVFMGRASGFVAVAGAFVMLDGRQHFFERRCVHRAPPFVLAASKRLNNSMRAIMPRTGRIGESS